MNRSGFDDSFAGARATLVRIGNRTSSSSALLRRLLLLLLPLAACEISTLPNGAQRFTPPAVYRQWWALTEACSGLHGSFDAVQWYQIPDATTLQLPNGQVVNAMETNNRIVIAAGMDGLYSGDLVRHEMLHALLRTGGHPRDAFIGKCGGVVVCVDYCDAGPQAAPPPDPAAVPVDPSSLDIGVEVASVSPTLPDTERYVMMVVTARNPSKQSWQMRLPTTSNVGVRGAFGFRLVSDRGEERWYDMPANAPEVTRFAPGETKQFIFDFWVRGPVVTRYDLTPSTWTFRGGYNGVWAPQSPTLSLEP